MTIKVEYLRKEDFIDPPKEDLFKDDEFKDSPTFYFQDPTCRCSEQKAIPYTCVCSNCSKIIDSLL